LSLCYVPFFVCSCDTCSVFIQYAKDEPLFMGCNPTKHY
jgi:hypothetical protein